MKDRQLEREQEHQQEMTQPEAAEPENAEPAAVTEEARQEEAGPDQAEADLEALRQQWEQERADLVNRLLRMKADFDNYKRRSESQLEAIKATANQNLLTELLPVIDNFERAIAAAEDDSPYLAGVKMIFEQLMDCLYKEGLTPVESVAKPFDPTVHQAVSMEGDSDVDLIVVEELQKGYFYKDRLLRASMVKVAPRQQHEEE